MDTPKPSPDPEPDDLGLYLEVREYGGRLISRDLIPRLTNPWLVWFTAQGASSRILSARKASKRERQDYGENVSS